MRPLQTFCKFILLTLASLVLALPTSTQAQVLDKSFTILNFDSAIVVKSDGTLDITERIQTNFTEEKHGIYRDIPTLFTQNNEEVRILVQPLEITLNGQAVPYKTSSTYKATRFKIGDPERTISGPQVYTLRYSVLGALRPTSTGTIELAWNVTGNQWEVPINHAGAAIQIPSGAFINSACYRGPVASTEKCTGITADKNEVTVLEKKNLEAGEGLTFAVSFPKGVASTPVVAVGINPSTLLFLIVIAFFAISLIASILWYRKNGSDLAKMRKTLVPEYDQPGKLTPAECCMLLHETGRPEIISSTLVDFARRGFITIANKPLTILFGKTLRNDYILKRIDKKRPNLNQYETLIFDLYFPDDRVTASTKEVGSNSAMPSLLQAIYSMVQDHLVQTGHIFESPKKTGKPAKIIGAVLAAISIISLTIFIQQPVEVVGVSTVTDGILLGICIGAILSAFSWFYVGGASSRRTVRGVRSTEHIRGYQLFLKNTEKYRQPWLEKEGAFAKLLPYAMALGVSSEFVKSMQTNYPNTTVPLWYVGGGNFSDFSSDMHSLGSVVTSTVSTAGTSSSGGGFSGGGFGGGGGGSW